MSARDLTLSIAIPTYRREQVLLETIGQLLELARTTTSFEELILIDQTPEHAPATEAQLDAWSKGGSIRWLRSSEANLTRAMNRGLIEARGDIVLFVDDDVIPGPDLLRGHIAAYRANPALWAVVGQILQPGEEPAMIAYRPRGGQLRRFMDFPFRTTEGAFVENVIACNLSVHRERSVLAGGFDENFPPPVAARFESEFAKRVVAMGGLIWFEPGASVRHLQAPQGGTRSKGHHLTSALPIHGVGDYYFALRQGKGWEKWFYILKKPFREVRTKFHLRHPWWIPVKLVGEVRAFAQALRLSRNRPRLIKPADQPGVERVEGKVV